MVVTGSGATIIWLVSMMSLVNSEYRSVDVDMFLGREQEVELLVNDSKLMQGWAEDELTCACGDDIRSRDPLFGFSVRLT